MTAHARCKGEQHADRGYPYDDDRGQNAPLFKVEPSAQYHRASVDSRSDEHRGDGRETQHHDPRLCLTVVAHGDSLAERSSDWGSSDTAGPCKRVLPGGRGDDRLKNLTDGGGDMHMRIQVGMSRKLESDIKRCKAAKNKQPTT